MLTSSTLTLSMGSGERKRCSNMAPVRRLRSFAWMKARRLPGVRCSTLKTECKSLLCLMIMPGRSWVAGIDIAGLHLLTVCQEFWAAGQVAGASAAHGSQIKQLFYTARGSCGNGLPIRRILYRLLPRTAETDFLRAGGIPVAYIDRSGCGSGFVWRELDLDGAAFRRSERCRAVVGGHNEVVGC